MNPAVFCYSSTTGLEEIAQPSLLVVAGRSNRYDPAFQAARAKGAEVFAYLNVLNRPDSIGANEPVLLDFHLGDLSRVPLWNFSGVSRTNFKNTKLIDIWSPAWREHVASYVEALIRESKFDGLFLDTLGARPWGSDFDQWPLAEKQAWTAGTVAMLKLIDEVRQRINPRFKLLCNNHWDNAEEAEPHCDGVCLENVPLTDFRRNIAAREYANKGQRRVLVIAKTDAEALAWSTVPGVTHVVSVEKEIGESYQRPTPPVVGFEDLRQAEADAYIARLKAERDTFEDEAYLAQAQCLKLVADAEAAKALCAQRTAERDALVQAVDVLDERLEAIRQIAEAPR